jgi:hypothetical protein
VISRSQESKEVSSSTRIRCVLALYVAHWANFFRFNVDENFCLKEGVSMPATFSAENRIAQALQGFGSSQRSFVLLAQNLGVHIPTGSFSEFLSGKRNLEVATIDRLFEVLARMDDLAKSVSPVPVDWGRTEQVATAMAMRLVAQIGQEQRFEDLAEQATKLVTA